MGSKRERHGAAWGEHVARFRCGGRARPQVNKWLIFLALGNNATDLAQSKPGTSTFRTHHEMNARLSTVFNTLESHYHYLVRRMTLLRLPTHAGCQGR